MAAPKFTHDQRVRNRVTGATGIVDAIVLDRNDVIRYRVKLGPTTSDVWEAGACEAAPPPAEPRAERWPDPKAPDARQARPLF